MTSNAKKIILVIEDNEKLQKAIFKRLTLEKFTVQACATAEQAIDYLKKNTPGLIWLDLLLPGMNGLEFLNWLRKSEKKNIPVIVVSNSGGPGKVAEAFNLNVADYLVKTNYRLEDIIANIKKRI
ncbi:MAG: response regulator [Patescibacteria group bacterium]